MKIIQGDCLEKLKDIENNSIDSIVTDPPYELGFMGKKWDNTGIANNVEMWKECFRVLKPGGNLLAFSGTRTYHRMASAIEDAGFEVRDMIAWVYGSGFPKSLSIGKAVNSLETKEWLNIGKAIDNININDYIEAWKSNSNNVKIVETQSLKNQIIAGQDTQSESFVVLNVAQNNNQESSNLLVSFVEQNLNEAPAINTKANTALLSVETEIRQLQNNVKSAEQQLQNQNHKSWNIFTAQCDVREWLNENTEVSHKVDEALKILRGNKKYSNEEITNVLCVVIPSVLKHTILNQSKTFQNLDTNQKMECVSAINVIITEYTAENLISNTVAILRSKAVDKLQGNERKVVGTTKSGISNKNGESNNGSTWNRVATEVDLTKGTSEWEGWGTALKPAHEPICMAMKPKEDKFILDACCGGKMFWFDKNHPNTLYIDKRTCEKGHNKAKPNHEVKPDLLMDFTDLKFADKTFNMVVFDPPHLFLGETSKFAKDYGTLKNTNWEQDITSGFSECFRVLKDYGTLIFKWNEFDIPVDKILSLTDVKPLFGQRSGKQGKTHWIAFMKIPEEQQQNATPSHEPICMARKPLAEKNLANNVLKWGTGGINIDESRVEASNTKELYRKPTEYKNISPSAGMNASKTRGSVTDDYLKGRFPANLIHDGSDEVRECFPNESERFFKSIIYQAKSSKSERTAQGKIINNHPTLKPVALMEYLIKMVTRKGGIVLDPFMGSGSTGVAARNNGYNFIGIEKEEEYFKIAQNRINESKSN